MEWKRKQFKIKKIKIFRTFKETVTNFLGRKEERGEEQVEGSWKVIKTPIMESAERVVKFA